MWLPAEFSKGPARFALFYLLAVKPFWALKGSVMRNARCDRVV